MKRQQNRHGLILLVVLGMLALFSLLAVTYVVFASQTRATSVQHTRRYVRETQAKPLMEEAVKQLIRGTNSSDSVMRGSNLLADVYGDREGAVLSVRPNLTHFPTNLERPMLLGGRVAAGSYSPGYFLRIPIDNSTVALPEANDVLNGRVITFPAGQGPLSGQSFRIVRYIGNDTSLPGIRFSIVIDLTEADLGREHTQITYGGSAPIPESATVAEWMQRVPNVVNSGSWAAGVYLCYASVGLDPNTRLLQNGYQFFLNGAPLNGHGRGIAADGSSQMHVLVPGANPADIHPAINEMAVGLQPILSRLPNAVSRLRNPNGSLVASSVENVVGDSDEPYDAADYNNMYLSYKDGDTGEIIPSFHRAALINYIVNFKPLPEYTELELWATIRRIQLATGRPLSLNVVTPNGVPGFMQGQQFHNQFGSGAIPTLTLNILNPWNTNWPTIGVPAFRAWLDALTGQNTFDVDNLGDGIPDSIWADIGLPLQRTADGKLLKALVAYYVEDMDGKLDINAVGSTTQANNYGSILYTRPSRLQSSGSFESPYALGNTEPVGSGNSVYFHQGVGYGPADVSFRHLLGKTGLQWNGVSGQDRAEIAYRSMIAERYRTPASANILPGSSLGHDAISQLNLRESRTIHRHGSLPGLPLGVRGRLSIAIDRLGNPIIHNHQNPINSDQTEYAARLMSHPHQDSPFTIADWERIYRLNDADRQTLPERLQNLFGVTDSGLSAPGIRSLRHEITPVSRSLNYAKVSGRGIDSSQSSPSSFIELVNTIRELRGQADLTYAIYASLFPLEFQRGSSLNLNRPFGNGVDDNNDGQIDEPLEIAVGYAVAANAGNAFEKVYDATGVASVGNSGVPSGDAEASQLAYPFDASLDPNVTTSTAIYFRGQESRQRFARHLYCLAQLLIPEDYAFPNIDHAYWDDLTRARIQGDAQAIAKHAEIRSRILAQWAVNIVDWRDSDAVMTRFPYDENPFDGWALPATPKVVWGMEQPELLLTESLAFHDVRVRRDPTANPARFDQFRMPQGSLFLELFCPRTTETGTAAANSTQLPGVPSGLYTTNGSGDVVLNVGQLTPASVAGVSGLTQFPVWRVYISEPAVKSDTNPILKTPNERLVAPAAADRNSPTRFDLTYQLPNSNLMGGTGGPHPNGLMFDHTGEHILGNQNQRLDEPDTAQARVIVFADDNSFTPTASNTPGVQDPVAQVFHNRATSSPLLHGNQYMVVGPRVVTHIGSLETARQDPPSNLPNLQSIELPSSKQWVELRKPDGTLYRDLDTSRVKEVVHVVAAADRPTSWSNPNTLQQIGISVSEPLPSAYYPEPTARVNPSVPAGQDPFPFDGYWDYTTGPAPARTPRDSGATGPLVRWDLNGDGSADTLNNHGGVVKPGTMLDWCTAYLQRLADPSKPWHATFNPYITVDWLPIDLTVFSGEENEGELTPPPPIPNDPRTKIHFASRQKSGQSIDSSVMQFNTSNQTGLTFLSPLSHAPQETGPEPSLTSFFKYSIKGDEIGLARPSRCVNGEPRFVADSTAFATLGFLNSTYLLNTESGITNLPPVPPAFIGAPADPTLPAGTRSPTWHPETVFWGNRKFINSFELAYVPLSSPGQLGQEFTAANQLSASQNYYEPTYKLAGYPQDPRMPTSPYTVGVSATDVPDANISEIEFSITNYNGLFLGNPRGPFPGSRFSNAYYPYAHLMNFFQEVPEVRTPSTHLSGINRFRNIHPKDTSLALLLDLASTPSPWADVENPRSPSEFRLNPTTGIPPELVPIATIHNALMEPLRSPHNNLPRHAEPGRVNLNTVSQQNVLQGLFSNLLRPSDIDFEPYFPGTAFGSPSDPNDFDYNANNVIDSGQRTLAGQMNLLPGGLQFWDSFKLSRRGYPLFDFTARDGLGFYRPIDGSNRFFNPHFPTKFASLFKPSSEAGMVPRTRNPFEPPHRALPVAPFDAQEVNDYVRGRQYGILDSRSRQIPAFATILRPDETVSGNPPLFRDFQRTYNQRHPHTDFYPIARLQKLVTERSNVFAVYVTIGLFEYDETSGLGREYGLDNGQNKRLKAFYVIDRSVPVGYRVGEDLNTENTILVRRILSE